MKKLKRPAALLLCLLLLGSLNACASDYPVTNRRLDVAELINTVFEGSGYVVNVDTAEITVSAAADRLYIDEDASAETVEALRQAVRSASAPQSGLHGMWVGELDISPLLCESFQDLKGIDISDYLHDITLPAQLTLAENGMYLLRFSEDDLPAVEKKILSAGGDAVRAYLAANSTGLTKLIGSSLDQSSIDAILSHVVSFAMETLRNGSGGYYSVTAGVLRLNGNKAAMYTLEEDTLLLSGSASGGLLGCLTNGEHSFRRS